jgi:hypothetical protein
LVGCTTRPSTLSRLNTKQEPVPQDKAVGIMNAYEVEIAGVQVRSMRSSHVAPQS